MNAPADKNQTKKQNEVPKYMFHVEPDGAIHPGAVVRGNAVPEIPPGVYSLEAKPEFGFYLAPVADFKLPERVYGDVHKHVDRFLRSYELNDKNLGVLLIGDAGSGKTLTLKSVVEKAQKLGMPVILVNENYAGGALVNFLDKIAQQCVVCFDEFDKVFSENSQDGTSHASPNQRSVLQLLDGTSSGAKKLYIFTANDDGMINAYMKNRPSRIRYTIRYKRMEVNTVVEYVTENLKNCTDDHVQAFVHLTLAKAVSSAGLNFDMMRELVREMNQFGGDVTDAIDLMMSSGKKSFSYFHITSFEEDENKNRIKRDIAYALGTHSGPYVTKDDTSIKFTITEKREATEEDEDDSSSRPSYMMAAAGTFMLGEKKISLTQADFVSFGSDHTQLEFAKDGMIFVCRYIESGEYTNNHYEVQEQARENIKGVNKLNREHSKKVAELRRQQHEEAGGHPGELPPNGEAFATGVLTQLVSGATKMVEGGPTGRASSATYPVGVLGRGGAMQPFQPIRKLQNSGMSGSKMPAVYPSKPAGEDGNKY